MRKLHLAIVPASLTALALAGCGGQSSSSAVSDDLDDLIVNVRQLDAAAAPGTNNKLAYSSDSMSPHAAYIDQAVSLIPDADKIVNNPDSSPRQKSAANQIIAGIKADEAWYLIKTGQDDYVRLRQPVGDLHDTARQVVAIQTRSAELSGDRDLVIQTIQTGETGTGTTVNGIDQLEAESATLTDQARDAQAAHDDIATQIKKLDDQVAEYEAIEQDLRNQAQVATGATRFEKLDQATTAAYEAELAAAKAEQLALDAEISGQTASLAEAHRERLAAAITELEAKIAAIQEEKRLIAGKLDELETIRAASVATLENDFTKIDAQLQTLAFDRFAAAVSRLAEAEAALAGVTASGSGRSAIDLEVMSTYTLHLRALQAEALAARSYRDALASLAAAGPQVLGQTLHGKVTTRIGALNTRLADLVMAVNELKTANDIDSLIGSLQNSFEAETPEAALVQEHVALFGTLQQNITDAAQPDAGE